MSKKDLIIKTTVKAKNSKDHKTKDAQDHHPGKRYQLRTRLIHGSTRTPRWDYTHHVVPPITSSATFRLNSTQRGAKGFFEFACDSIDTTRHIPIYIYDRLDEPTRGMLEESLALAEGGDYAVCFATGMAAITAAFGVLLESGDEVIAHDTLYGCTYSYLTNWAPRNGVKPHFVNCGDVQSIERCINKKTRVIYLESPVNPTMELVDITAIRKMLDRHNHGRVSRHKIRIIVDNTFATPYCQRPLELGADMVVHSLTKAIGGFGTDMGGVVVVPAELHNTLMMYRKDYGGVLSPKAAWNVLVFGLPTLVTRMEAMQQNAMKIAKFLDGHAKVEKVLYPGLADFPQRTLARRMMTTPQGKFAPGSMIYFVIKDRSKTHHAAERFVNYIADHAYTITLAVSLGQVKTLIENPYSMTHSAYLGADQEIRRHTLDPGGIRLSIGLEDSNDIIADLNRALKQV